MAELWKWWYADPVTGRRLKTRYVCTEEDARGRYGQGVERVEGSREVRELGAAEISPGYMSKKPGE
jgi:hypothetical protein